MNTIKTICRACGKEGAADVDDFTFDVFSRPGQVYPWYCPECDVIHRREKEEQERREREEERRNYIEEELERAGIPRRYRVKAPPVPTVADWLRHHAGDNILITGETGSGKSTSAGYLARGFIESEKTVRYRQMSDILDDWREARSGDYRVTSSEFFGKLENVDLLIVDEASPDKCVVSSSGRECMFRLLEDIYNGTCRAAVIFLGNYFRGSIGEVFGNEAAARRRLADAFVCAKIEKGGHVARIKL